MTWVLYVAIGLSVALFAVIFGAFFVAAIMDWNYQRKNRVWIELQRNHTERRRPVAK